MVSGSADPANSREIVQKWSQRGRAIQAQVAKIQVRAVSRNSELSATVDAHGHVRDIRLTPQALHLGESRLAQLLTETLQRAQTDAARQVEQAWKPHTSDPAVREIFDFGRALIEPRQSGPQDTPVNEDDLPWEEQVRLQQERIRNQFRRR
jgi:DNA-binding protein YbaB